MWDEEIEPEVFESKWWKVLSEFKLVDHKWLCKLYELRRFWIPAYFRDLYLAGLMRTTSRSECENSFFTLSTTPGISLVEFYMRFESSLESQRHNQEKNDYDCEQKHPECNTQVPIELHASNVYTISVFGDIQKSIKVACGLDSFGLDNGAEVYQVKEIVRGRTFKVCFNAINKESSCSCKLFQRKGLPCTHMIWVWNIKMLSTIPDQYIHKRWCKDASKICDSDHELMKQCSSIDCKKRLIYSMWSELYVCADLIQHSEDDIKKFTEMVQSFRADVLSRTHASKGDKMSSKVQEIEMLIGASVPSEISILPPKVSKNKGTGVHLNSLSRDKRLKSNREKAVEGNRKKRRKCKFCSDSDDHDTRNCPTKVKD